jgi:hypothetical protein
LLLRRLISVIHRYFVTFQRNISIQRTLTFNQMTSMMKRILSVLCLFFLVSINVYSQDETPFIEGDLLVMLEKGESTDNILSFLNTVDGTLSGVQIDKQLSKQSNIYLLKFDHTKVDQYLMLETVRSFGSVRAAQFNHHVQDRATLPNDPSIGTQWHHVDGSDNDIDSDLAWDITTGGQTANGDDIVVCILEGGGSNYNHVDIIANHWTNTAEIDGNGVDDDGNGYIDDVNGWNSTANDDNIAAGGHGTAVSGMIGAKGNNNNGGSGVNWDVKLMQVDMGGLSEAQVILAYSYPHDNRVLYNTTNGASGAFVVATNASWGIDNANPANYPLWCAYYDDMGADGILNCGATANNNVNIDVVGDMPTGCGSDYMVAVTATNSSDVRTFSGYGATTIDLGAPGESVYLPSGSTGYSSTSGTSFASPCVAGGIAMVYSAPCTDLASLSLSNPQLAADNVRGYILDGVDVVANLVGECVTGGRLNVRGAIDLALLDCGPLAPCNPVDLLLATDCYYDGGSGQVEAQIHVDVTMSENYCEVFTVCYSDGGPVVCDDLQALGISLDNNNTYAIQGLASNTSYDVYYTTDNGTSATVSITTPDCSSEIPGCTDALASNYDPLATFDDGSCTFPCSDVTLTINTDCWGNEVSWDLVDDGGNVVASVAGGTYGNQASFTWSDCLEWGCYTFNIYDSFGDGLDGTASGCAIDGSYDMYDSGGNLVFEMGDPNYGAGTSHAFCLPIGAILGCTDGTACNFNAAATQDDGSCTYPGCTDPTACNYNAAAGYDDGSCTPSGCTDGAACNFDPAAQCDDGSCAYPGCDDPTACNYNAAAGCSDGSCTYPGCDDVAACNYDPAAGCNNGGCQYPGCITLGACNWNPIAGCDDGSCVFPGCQDVAACNFDPAAGCNDGSCEYLTCAGCTDPGACNHDPSATIEDGTCTYPGCNDVIACNYNAAAGCDDGSCTYPGCTDAGACNYDAAAGCDDGTCEFTSCLCIADFNGDLSIDVQDLLIFLADFGCTSGCAADLTGDDITNSADLLVFLTFFGTTCN